MTQQLDNSLQNSGCDSTNHQAKSEYEGYMESRLKDLGANIDELAEKVGAAKSKTVEDLRLKQEHASNKLHELKATSSEAWLELKKGMDLAWSDLGRTFEEFKSATHRAASKFEK